jgi:hypothetical protein
MPTVKMSSSLFYILDPLDTGISCLMETPWGYPVMIPSGHISDRALGTLIRIGTLVMTPKQLERALAEDHQIVRNVIHE